MRSSSDSSPSTVLRFRLSALHLERRLCPSLRSCDAVIFSQLLSIFFPYSVMLVKVVVEAIKVEAGQRCRRLEKPHHSRLRPVNHYNCTYFGFAWNFPKLGVPFNCDMAARELEELKCENIRKLWGLANKSERCNASGRPWQNSRIGRKNDGLDEKFVCSQRIVCFQVPFADHLLSPRGQFSLEILLVRGKRAG